MSDATGERPKERLLFLGTLATFVVLIASLHGIVVLPAWSSRGLDFQNLYAFHTHCPEWPIPYLRSGADCGDALGRSMVYPPLLYWVMAWVRFFSFPQAELIWSVAVLVLVVAGSALALADERKSARTTALWMLLFLQLPILYAVERGNVDAWIVFVFGAALFAYRRERFFASGALLAVSCWLKVYPTIPAFLLLAAVALDPEFRRRAFPSLVRGFVPTGALVGLALLPSSWTYVAHVLPEFSRQPGAIQPYTHILYKSVWAWLLIKLPIAFLWGRMAWRLLRKDPALAWTGVLAISTFFQHTSNDYNLITAYPFLYVVFNRLIRKDARATDWAVLALTLVVFVLDRSPWVPLTGNRGALYFQIVWLFGFPFFAASGLGERASAAIAPSA